MMVLLSKKGWGTILLFAVQSSMRIDLGIRIIETSCIIESVVLKATVALFSAILTVSHHHLPPHQYDQRCVFLSGPQE